MGSERQPDSWTSKSVFKLSIFADSYSEESSVI